MSAWMIRAGHGGVYAEDWLDKGRSASVGILEARISLP